MKPVIAVVVLLVLAGGTLLWWVMAKISQAMSELESYLTDWEGW